MVILSVWELTALSCRPKGPLPAQGTQTLCMELARAGEKCLLCSCFPGLCYLDKANVKLLAVQQCSTGCFFWFKLGTGLLFEMVSVSWRQISKSHSACRSSASPNPSFLPGHRLPVTWRAVSPVSFPDSGRGSPFRIKPFQCDWNVLKDSNVVFVEFWLHLVCPYLWICPSGALIWAARGCLVLSSVISWHPLVHTCTGRYSGVCRNRQERQSRVKEQRENEAVLRRWSVYLPILVSSVFNTL